MPTAAYSECRIPHCPNYAVAHGCCREHQVNGVGARGPVHHGLTPSNRRFRKRRACFMRHHPMCNACKREPASILDHIIPHRGDALLFWRESNWQSLCATCHGIKTARESWQHDSTAPRVIDVRATGEAHRVTTGTGL